MSYASSNLKSQNWIDPFANLVTFVTGFGKTRHAVMHKDNYLEKRN